MKNKKKRSNYIPNWIFLNQYDINDVRSYLEVDYFTLSIVIIYDPFFLSYITQNNVIDKKYSIYRLYN